MSSFLLVTFGLYFLLLLFFIAGWIRAIEPRTQKFVEAYKRISVVVPFRNEEETLSGLVQDLESQTYAHGSYEVLLIDDHSTDRSKEIAAEARTRECILIESLPQDIHGKKAAISHGVQLAKGDIIATVDADCRIPGNWLTRINESFQEPQVKFVSGGVKISPVDNFFYGLQSVELSSLIGSGVATLSWGMPTMSNGANLAFLKSTFVQVNGYAGNEHIPSGDDEFLMRKVHGHFKAGISFLSFQDAVITTQPQHSIKELIQQRIRWASKWKQDRPLHTQLLALFILIFQLSFLVSIYLWLSGAVDLRLVIPLIGGKVVLEFVFLSMVCEFLQIKLRLSHFVILQLVYPLYVLAISLISLRKGYHWKGRKVNE